MRVALKLDRGVYLETNKATSRADFNIKIKKMANFLHLRIFSGSNENPQVREDRALKLPIPLILYSLGSRDMFWLKIWISYEAGKVNKF